MKTLTKLQVLGVLGVCALAANAPSGAIESGGVELGSFELPDLKVATQQIAKQIAAELSAQLSAAVKAPRPVKARKSASVTIIEESEMVLVVATRLPQRHLADRSVDPLVVAKPVRTAQVRF